MSLPTSNLVPTVEKEKMKADGSNFLSWFRSLKTLLISLKMDYVLEAPLGDKPAYTATEDEKNVFLSRAGEYSLVQAGMLFDMEDELQKCFANMSAYEIITALKTDFAPKSMVARFNTFKFFIMTMMEEHGSIVEHVAKMSEYIQCLIVQEYDIPDELRLIGFCTRCPLATMNLSWIFSRKRFLNLYLSYLKC